MQYQKEAHEETINIKTKPCNLYGIFLSCLYQYDVDKDLLFKVICLKLKKVITYQKIKVENSKIKVGNPKIKSWNLK